MSKLLGLLMPQSSHLQNQALTTAVYSFLVSCTGYHKNIPNEEGSPQSSGGDLGTELWGFPLAELGAITVRGTGQQNCTGLKGWSVQDPAPYSGPAALCLPSQETMTFILPPASSLATYQRHLGLEQNFTSSDKHSSAMTESTDIPSLHLEKHRYQPPSVLRMQGATPSMHLRLIRSLLTFL